MKMLIRFSLLLIIFNLRSRQESGCDAENDQCSVSEPKSIMLQAAEEIQTDKALGSTGTLDTESLENDHFSGSEPQSVLLQAAEEIKEDKALGGTASPETLAINVSQIEADIEDTEKMVTGDYEPCERREMDGQLYRSLMVNGGYSLEAGAGLVRVHCQPRTDRFLSNGYYVARGYAPGDEDREEPVVIVAMLPGQGLQPHSHDLDEELLVG